MITPQMTVLFQRRFTICVLQVFDVLGVAAIGIATFVVVAVVAVVVVVSNAYWVVVIVILSQ